jgi:ubiquinone/menaquinone biosynthesis C-methylase UbiE
VNITRQPETTRSARATFSDRPDRYVAARPHYPEELFDWLAARCPRRDVVWDCATGNGQAAVGLAPRFRKVIAADVSPQQIAHRMVGENIDYLVSRAEDSGLAAAAVDLVTVAQALHWFDFSRFWPEVARVAREQAFFCAWGYDWPITVDEVQRALVAPFRAIIAPFWAPNNKLLWDGYKAAEVAFPFAPAATPELTIQLAWSLAQLLDFMMTWSAFKRSREDAAAKAAMDDLLARAARLVPPDRILPVRMTLKMLAGRVHPARRR